MKLCHIALKNLTRNQRFYRLYFVSVAVVLAVFFCFLSFSQNTLILEKISADGRVEAMCRVIAILLMAFVLFYMAYSSRFFTGRRLKELGIYALLGWRKIRIVALLSFENTVICLLALVAGIFAGGILHWMVTVGITTFLHLSVDLMAIPLWNAKAVAGCMIFTFFVIGFLILVNAWTVGKSSLLSILQTEKTAEKPVKCHPIMGTLGFMLMAASYVLAADSGRGIASLWVKIGFMPIAAVTLTCAVAGTALTVTSLLPQAALAFKKRVWHRPVQLISLSKYLRQVRSNAGATILTILLSAGTLAIFGATLLSVVYPTAATRRIVPSAIEARIELPGQVEASRTLLDMRLGQGNYTLNTTEILTVQAEGNVLPDEYTLGTENGQRLPSFECIAERDYQALLLAQGREASASLSANGAHYIRYNRPEAGESILGQSYRLGDISEVKIETESLDNVVGFANCTACLVLPDRVWDRLKASGAQIVTVMSVNGPELRQDVATAEALQSIFGSSPYYASAALRVQTIMTANSATFLLIGFITIVFFIATGSILYFKHLSAALYDREEYRMLSRMGYRRRQLEAITTSPVRTGFAIPYVLSLLNGGFGIYAYQALLVDHSLAGLETVFIPVLAAVAVFTLVYYVYYRLTRASCIRVALRF